MAGVRSQEKESIMADLKELQEEMNTMLVTVATNVAKIEVLQSAVWQLFKLTGGDQLDGLRFDDWFVRAYRAKLQDMLIKIEDKSSGLAARLQDILDESDRRAGR